MGEQRVVRGAWWLPGVLLISLVVWVNIFYQAWDCLRTGCGAGPALWRQTAELDAEEFDELRRMVAKGCDSYAASKYNFGMGLTAAWKVHSPPCEAAWEGHQQQRQARQKASKVKQLFHGTGKDAARAPSAPPSQGPCTLSTRTSAASRSDHPHLSTPHYPRAAGARHPHPHPNPHPNPSARRHPR